MKKKTNIETTRSSGNVFADLGLTDAKELQGRGLIGMHLVQVLKAKDMKQKDIAEMLGLNPAEVSHLFNGHFSRFSTDKLLGLLADLEQKVTIHISPRKQGSHSRKSPSPDLGSCH
jgi:predicted XRE-type DNA-binding protein